MFAVVPALTLAALALALTPSPVCAQEVVRDSARFRSPAIFVPPDAPAEVLRQFGERSYRVQVAIDEKGAVEGVRTLEPPDPEFRAHLDKAARFWLFYPEVEPGTCRPVPSSGVVELTYRAGAESPRVWLTVDPAKRLLQTPPARPVNQPTVPFYPLREQREGVTGRVFMLGQLNPQGEVVRTQLLLGLPPRPGFVQVAGEHLAETRFDAGLAETRCVVVEYIFKLPE